MGNNNPKVANKNDLQPMFHAQSLIALTQLRQHLPYYALSHTLRQTMTIPVQYSKHTHKSEMIQILKSACVSDCAHKSSEISHK
jgi:hypothetical protein